MDANAMIDKVHDTTTPSTGAGRWFALAEAVCRETAALVRQTPLMVRDLSWKPVALAAETTELVVVLHGLFATAGALRPLRHAIERTTGLPTASFTYVPGCDVATLSARLAALLADAPSQARVHLVGHSLGGLVARYFVQVAPRDERVVQTISLGSPFAGTRVAAVVPRFVSRDVAVGSRVLREIERAWRHGEHVPHTSIVASHDQLVSPVWSAAYPHGDVVVACARGHNALLFDGEVSQLVADAVRRRCGRREAVGVASAARARRLVVVPGMASWPPTDPTSLPVAAG